MLVEARTAGNHLLSTPNMQMKQLPAHKEKNLGIETTLKKQNLSNLSRKLNTKQINIKDQRPTS